MAQPTQIGGFSIIGADDSAKVTLSVTTTTDRVAIPTTALMVEITMDADGYVQLGDSTVTAATTSRFFPAGAAHYKVLGGQTHVAAILGSGTANLTVTPLE